MANPYELRYDIYQQASQRLMDKFHQDHALWQDFEEWKRHKKPKEAYLGTFIEGGPGGSNPTYRKYYKGMLD